MYVNSQKLHPQSFLHNTKDIPLESLFSHGPAAEISVTTGFVNFPAFLSFMSLVPHSRSECFNS